jgi:hypothetical protein
MLMTQLGAVGSYLNTLRLYSLLTIRHVQPSDSTPHHLVLLVDPQLVDLYTYPDHPWPLSTLTNLRTDLYLHQSMKQIQKYLHLDTIIFPRRPVRRWTRIGHTADLVSQGSLQKIWRRFMDE